MITTANPGRSVIRPGGLRVLNRTSFRGCYISLARKEHALLLRSAKRWLSVFTAGTLVVLGLLGSAAPANAASVSLLLPFKIGQTWFVCQGYNTTEIDHTGGQVDALDLSISPTAASGTYGCVGGPSASQGQAVYAPAAGTIVSQCCHSPVNDMVCLDTTAGGSLMIGHMGGLPAVGTQVPASHKLGTVNPPGTTTNEGKYSHIHIAAYASNNCSGTSIPFDDAHGTRFSYAPNLPSDGSAHQYYGRYLSAAGSVTSTGNAQMAIQFTLPGISPIGVDNNAPKHPQRAATVIILNSAKSIVATKSLTATYSSTNGDFAAIANLGSAWKSGNYFVTVRLSNTLAQTMGRYSGSQFYLASGKKAFLPRTPLFSGDINGDNSMNVLDYNILLNCWNNTGCSTSQKTASDLNDDGSVNQVDYNIWLRSVSGAGVDCSNGICVYNKVW